MVTASMAGPCGRHGALCCMPISTAFSCVIHVSPKLGMALSNHAASGACVLQLMSALPVMHLVTVAKV